MREKIWGGKSDPYLDALGEEVAGVDIFVDAENPTKHKLNIEDGLTDDESRATTMGHELSHAKDAITKDVDKYIEDKNSGKGEQRAQNVEGKIREEIVREREKDKQR